MSDLTLVKNKGGRPVLAKIHGSKYAPTLTVIDPDGSKLEIPIDELSAKAQRKMLTVKARDFFEVHLEKMRNKVLTPAEIKDMLSAAARVNDMMRAEWAAELNESTLPGGGPSTPLGRQVGQMIGQAARGAAAGAADAFKQQLEAMDKAAKKVDEAIIDVPSK